MKGVKFILPFLVVLSLTVNGQGLSNEKVRWYNFSWEGDSKNPRSAMILSSLVDSINFNFRWQFDTGSPRSFFYGSSWTSLTAAYPRLKKLFFVVDSSKGDGYVNLRNNKLKFSGQALPNNIIGLLEGYGSELDKSTIAKDLGKSITIGTIGLDAFRNYVLVIDFKTSRIGVAGKLSEKFYGMKANTIDFILYQNRIVVPVLFKKKIFYFFYDSGASLFPMKTTTAYVKNLPAINYTDTLKNVTTWGKSYDVPGGMLSTPVRIGNMKVINPKIYVHPDPESYHTNVFKEANTFGLIGNAFFENKIVVFDFTRMKLTILE